MQLEEFKTKYKYEVATPVMRQYLDIKFANIDCLVLFRMGDFYELFYEDAITASRVLGIALTKRGKTDADIIPMCGVPHHALENYLNKLLDDDFKVAICDQTETPEQAKNRGGYKAVVNRSISRIITPGTIIEESLLDAGIPNYLVSVAIHKEDAAIASIDLATSNFSIIYVPRNEIINELARISPKEILLSEKYRADDLANEISNSLDMKISFQVDSCYSVNRCKKNILDFYKIQDLSAIGYLNNVQIMALGNVLEYLTLTQKDNMPRLPLPKIISYNKFMGIDSSTRRSLELTNNTNNGAISGSLLSQLDKCVTKLGKRLLYSYVSAPLIELNAINKRLDITDFFANNLNITEATRLLMKQTGDLERCITRINMNKSTPKDLLSIKYTIDIAEKLMSIFVRDEANIENNIQEIINPLIGLDEIRELIENSIREDAGNIITNGNVINTSYHPKVAELHDLINNGRQNIEKLRDKYRQETSIETLKINSNNVLGLFIDVGARHADKIKDEKFIHRQSTANSVRYTTTELQELEGKMINAKTLVESLEYEIYQKICAEIQQNQHKLLRMAQSIALLDVFCNFAHIADENNYCKPAVSDDHILNIEGGRHPVVEKSLEKLGNSFIANDCHFDTDERIWLITGPNMAGKSTFLRQNAIITIMAHIGCYVPATKAHIGIVDKIFSRIGAGDDLGKGQSTFMLEMLETSAIIAQSSPRSLIILDEVGRGTSTYDGVAIAWSVLEHIHDKIKARCLFATHYHELTAMDKILPAMKNYTVAIEESGDEIIFMHKITQGAASKSYGVHVAELAGLPKSVINKAKSILKKLEKNSDGSNAKILKNESHSMNLFENTNLSLRGADASSSLRMSEHAKCGNLSHKNSNSPDHHVAGAPRDGENIEGENAITLYDEFKKIDPDKLSPREALDLLYRLKDINKEGYYE